MTEKAENKLNVYKKLQKARVILQERELKRTGKNEYSKYEYFELSDFIQEVNKIFDEVGLCGIVSYTNEFATLTIVDSDSENSKEIIFTSPMGDINLKGCHPVQNIGALETYQRRYLYMTALEIVACDVLEKDTGKPANNSKQKELTDNQINRYYAIANSKDIEKVKADFLIKVKFHKVINQLTKEEYDKICSTLETDTDKIIEWLNKQYKEN